MYNVFILEFYLEMDGRFEDFNLIFLEVFDRIYYKKIVSVYLVDKEVILKVLEVVKSDKSCFS